jgi:hypothetical protein
LQPSVTKRDGNQGLTHPGNVAQTIEVARPGCANIFGNSWDSKDVLKYKVIRAPDVESVPVGNHEALP